ncbi:response regulator transcription factor [Marinoscillum pacificum]|uniref:response regulator transcription factor n=1 Tax=Marinoscillum pacificum TaxID=392723 RepID=UPI002158543B|nr:LuxR C-terminal-related transcriptional regulator [Marinoscillum pacificum]
MNASNTLPNYHLRLVSDNPETNNLQVISAIKTIPVIDFTEREIDILNLMSEGLTAEMIGDSLCISPHTVKTHQRNMLKKTGCSNGTQLVARSIRTGII